MYRKRKLIAVIMLAVFFILTASSLALADQPPPLLNNSNIQSYNQQNPPSYGERFIAGIISGSVKWLMNVFDMDDPTLLVFNKDPRTGAEKNDSFLANGVYGSLLKTPAQLVLGIFPLYFFKAVAILYDGFTKLLPIPLVLIMVIMGIIFMINSGTTEGRNKIKDYVQAFITALVTLRFGAYIWIAIVSLIQFSVKLIWAYMIQSGVTPGFFMDMIWGGGKAGFNTATQMGSLPMAVLLLIAAMMVLSLNYQFVMRIIIMGALILTFPFVTTASTYPGYRHSLQIWMQEFVAQAILPLADALALGAYFLMRIMPGIGQGGAFWLAIAYFTGLPAITSLIREFLKLPGGVRGGFIGAAAGMTGIAAMGSLGRMVRRNPASQGTEGGMPLDGQTGGQMGGQAGGFSTMKLSPKLTGATSFKGKLAQGAFNTGSAVLGNKYVQGGLKTAGRSALGITAATAGAALSTMTTGSALPGLMLGARAGSALNASAGRMAGDLGNGVTTVAQTISKTTSEGGGIREFGQNMVAQSMQNGGTLASMNWGLQAAANKLSTVAPTNGMFGEKQPLPFAAPGFVNKNKDTIRAAQSGMADLLPHLNMAQAKFEYVKAHFSPESEEYQNAFSQYNSLKDLQSMYKSESQLAQTKLRSPGELQRHTAGFSASRGRI